MNAYRQIFENVLFEFDWGQSEPENAVNDHQDFILATEDIATNPDYESLIARYLNWYVKCQAVQSTTGTDLLESPQGIEFRERSMAAFYARLQESDKYHPALLVHSHDCQLQQQDSICTPPYSFRPPGKIKTHQIHSCK